MQIDAKCLRAVLELSSPLKALSVYRGDLTSRAGVHLAECERGLRLPFISSRHTTYIAGRPDKGFAVCLYALYGVKCGRGASVRARCVRQCTRV